MKLNKDSKQVTSETQAKFTWCIRSEESFLQTVGQKYRKTEHSVLKIGKMDDTKQGCYV